uniref:Uncharacterized protein n=1 Tax=Pyrodinium bahamense TaxID=73915 RepID=A0A7S0AT88_9DINO|mmetsp:Transcript_41082/g.114185  ORF Transcript_41082/g.114185 Transcript_41082/m.114185 type:complete len:370 (+) Transcript_41082:138-1247(+)
MKMPRPSLAAAAVAALCGQLCAELGAASIVQGNHHRARHHAHQEPPAGLMWAAPASAPPGLAGAPAVAPESAGLITEGMEDLELEFEIKNYNYMDLEKAAEVHAEAGVTDQGSQLFGETVAETISKVIDQIIDEGMQSSGAPMPAAAPSPGPAVSPLPSEVNIFVNFQPGGLLQSSGGSRGALRNTLARITKVEVMITDKPMTGANYLMDVKSILAESQANGLLERRLKASLFQVTGLRPKISGLGKPVEMRAVEQWEETACEVHMQKVVRMFEVAYTRRMVPTALYNECTNMLPSLSFSHDTVASPLDRKKCRAATVKFAERWNYGEADWNYGKGESAEPMDFMEFCHDVCEIRYGQGAPQCLDKSPP